MKKFYLCGIAFQHELGETREIDIYDSLEACKAGHKCWEECGIVELETEEFPEDYTKRTWLVPQDLKWGRE